MTMSQAEFASPGAASQGNVVRVTVPIKVYYDLEALATVQREVFRQLGHDMCCSGWDVRYDVARQFQVDDQLNVRALNNL